MVIIVVACVILMIWVAGIFGLGGGLGHLNLR
jgi:hypothetical protein